MQSQKENIINTMLLIGMEEVLRQTEPHTEKEPAQQAHHNTCILFCVAVIIVMTTLSGIVEGQYGYNEWPLMLILRRLTHDHTPTPHIAHSLTKQH